MIRFASMNIMTINGEALGLKEANLLRDARVKS